MYGYDAEIYSESCPRMSRTSSMKETTSSFVAGVCWGKVAFLREAGPSTKRSNNCMLLLLLQTAFFR